MKPNACNGSKYALINMELQLIRVVVVPLQESIFAEGNV